MFLIEARFLEPQFRNEIVKRAASFWLLFVISFASVPVGRDASVTLAEGCTSQASRLPSSLSDICPVLFGPKPEFDAELFAETLARLKAHEPTTQKELQELINVPEKLLAMVEHLAEKMRDHLSPDTARRYSLSARIDSLSDKDLDLLKAAVQTRTPKGGFTSESLMKIAVFLYRVDHGTAGPKKVAWYEKDLMGAFKRLDDQFIEEHIKTVLFHEGLTKAFTTITRDPNLNERFLASLHNPVIGGWVESTLWISFALYNWFFLSPEALFQTMGLDPAVYNDTAFSQIKFFALALLRVPPGIPSFKQIFNSTFATRQLREAMNSGLDKLQDFPEAKAEEVPSKEIQSASQQAENRIKKLRWWNRLRTSYSVVFLAVALGTLYHGKQVYNSVKVQNLLSPLNQTLEEHKKLANRTPEEKAAALVNSTHVGSSDSKENVSKDGWTADDFALYEQYLAMYKEHPNWE